MSFRLAMKCRRAMSSLSRPHEILDQSYEYLIAQRKSGAGELLCLAEAGPCRETVPGAPRDLTPHYVMIGTLISRGPQPQSESFLLNTEIPDHARFEGMFLPAEGVVRLSWRKTGAVLSGVARITWARMTCYTKASQTIARALPTPPNPVGYVVHLDASELPWRKATRSMRPQPSAELEP